MTIPGHTRRDYRCPRCQRVDEILVRLSDAASFAVWCDTCDTQMSRYFGNTHSPLMNLGFVENRYSTEADANIAKYQFQHL